MQHTPGHSLQSVELGEIVAFLHEWTCHLTILSSERNGKQIILKFFYLRFTYELNIFSIYNNW